MNTNMTGLRWFSQSLCACALDESSLCIGRVKSTSALTSTCDDVKLFSHLFSVVALQLGQEALSVGVKYNVIHTLDPELANHLISRHLRHNCRNTINTINQ